MSEIEKLCSAGSLHFPRFLIVDRVSADTVRLRWLQDGKVCSREVPSSQVGTAVQNLLDNGIGAPDTLRGGHDYTSSPTNSL